METYQLPNELDGLVGVNGIDCRIEIKNAGQPPSKRALSDGEVETIEGWRGRRPVVIETEEDVINLVNALRKEACGRKN